RAANVSSFPPALPHSPTMTTVPFPASSHVSVKENAYPISPVATPSIGALSKATTKGRKRSITLVDGAELDLSAALPVTPELLQAMRLRIIQLEDELARPPAAKRVKIASSAVAAAADDQPAKSSSKADDKKRKMQVKKIFDRVKKECKSDSFKFQGSPKTLKIDEVLEVTEFEALFGGKGVLIQPRKDNKPKSTVTIIHLTNAAHVRDFFGDELKPLKGNTWSRGGIPQRGFGFFGGGGGLSKSVKQGSCDVEIASAEINYSKNGMKCSIKFEVQQVGGYGYFDDDW
ncbi:unnamed protein product, partial [Mycena citricolor]